MNKKLQAKKKRILKEVVQHVDITKIKAGPIIDAMEHMSFSSRDLARATRIYEKMLSDKSCTIVLSLAGSTSAGGCMKLYADLLKYNMVDAVVATGASIVDMDFFEALGFKHYKGDSTMNDSELRNLYIDRIYDTFIDEEDLQICDKTIEKIANKLDPRPYSSREFIYEMGKYLSKHSKKKDSLVEIAYKKGIPIFCPAFSDSSAGFGLVKHQWKNPKTHVSIDSVKDLLELTQIKMEAKNTGLLIIGGGTPKNFIQDTVICAEMLNKETPMHKYAIQITVADVRDGACSSSTLKEAQSWGKVSTTYEQMVFAEATTVLPLLASTAYHKGSWKKRKMKNWNNMFKS